MASIDSELMTGVALFLKDFGPYSVSLTAQHCSNLLANGKVWIAIFGNSK